MAMLKLYKSTFPSIQYVMPDGGVVEFVAGRFATAAPKLIAQLDAEIAAGHPHIFIDKNEKEVDSEAMDPLEVVKRKAVADYIASQKAANAIGNDRGNSVQGPARLTNSQDVASASAGMVAEPEAPVVAETATGVKISDAVKAKLATAGQK